MADNGALVTGIVAVVAFVGLFVMIGSGSVNDITGQAIGDGTWRGEHQVNPDAVLKSDHDAKNRYRAIQQMDNQRPGFTGENKRLSKIDCVEEGVYTLAIQINPVYGKKELRRYKDSAAFDYRCDGDAIKRVVLE